MASKNNKRVRDRLAVCSWSLQPATPTVLIERMQAIGLRRIQCALDPIRSLPEIWVSFAQRLSDAKMDLVSGMFGCVGEDYSSLESIRRTGGIVPDETWDENWENIQAVADIAKRLRLRLVTFHAGFLPHDPNDPGYEAMIHRMRLIAGVFAARGINVALETGQETAETLSRFLEDLGRANVGVNFDPASRVSPERMRKIRVFSGGVATSYISLDYRAQEGFIYRIAGSDEAESSFLKKILASRDSKIISEFGGKRIVREPVPIEKDEPLKLELRSFIDCIEARRNPVVTGASAKLALDLALEIGRQIAAS